jgi:hypothetical protein
VVSQAIPEMMAIFQNLNSKNAIGQIDKLVALYDRLIPKIEAMDIKDQPLISLRSQYVHNLRDANEYLRQSITAMRSGKLSTARQLAASSQSFGTKATQVGIQIDQYCGLTK